MLKIPDVWEIMLCAGVTSMNPENLTRGARVGSNGTEFFEWAVTAPQCPPPSPRRSARSFHL